MSGRVRGESRVALAPEPELTAGQLASNRVLSVKLKHYHLRRAARGRGE